MIESKFLQVFVAWFFPHHLFRTGASPGCNCPVRLSLNPAMHVPSSEFAPWLKSYASNCKIFNDKHFYGLQSELWPPLLHEKQTLLAGMRKRSYFNGSGSRSAKCMQKSIGLLQFIRYYFIQFTA